MNKTDDRARRKQENGDSAVSGLVAPKKNVTMRQVAEKAGVGLKTVSRVINQEHYVTQETSDRVWKAIKDLHYQVDVRARSLRRSDGRTNAFGLIISSVTNPFAGQVQSSIEDTLRVKNYTLITGSSHEDPLQEAVIFKDLVSRRVDGIILSSADSDPRNLKMAESLNIPLTFIDRKPAGVPADYVTSDNREASKSATLRLIEQGHRRIVLLTERLHVQTAMERQLGFRDAFVDAGIPFNQKSVISELANKEEARKAVSVLLRQSERPTAIFSAQNFITIGALHALYEAGLQHDIALIGFDDFDLFDLLDPGVSVISQNCVELGKQAAQLMLNKVNSTDSTVKSIVIPTTFIARGSGEIPPKPQV
ncbi:LacI family DNA-binding transcriptional regulator [Bifidobacterium sp. ESL0732]|uniref:LacI family DNA-binding transcriptional regulator n=1 Tax=Bifidobacterium sp. ESL0732 TaxID=2983222 RepID=UPI0023F8208C|nr:LacI family DNA-binding transcriptional regulator [Bifidobacterium sp. ESL0732]WEV63528.1 LacI family DNA-binding transcriptional regulator [Bifidobacterium sp. ESL0732]